MRLKIRCDGKSEKKIQNFLGTKQGLIPHIYFAKYMTRFFYLTLSYQIFFDMAILGYKPIRSSSH